MVVWDFFHQQYGCLNSWTSRSVAQFDRFLRLTVSICQSGGSKLVRGGSKDVCFFCWHQWFQWDIHAQKSCYKFMSKEENLWNYISGKSRLVKSDIAVYPHMCSVKVDDERCCASKPWFCLKILILIYEERLKVLGMMYLQTKWKGKGLKNPQITIVKKAMHCEWLLLLRYGSLMIHVYTFAFWLPTFPFASIQSIHSIVWRDVSSRQDFIEHYHLPIIAWYVLIPSYSL